MLRGLFFRAEKPSGAISRALVTALEVLARVQANIPDITRLV